MTPKTLTTIALMTGIFAANSGCKSDERTAIFANATTLQANAAFHAAKGTDIDLALLRLSVLDHGDPCVSVSEFEEGIEYRATDTLECQGIMAGKITVYGVHAPGWTKRLSRTLTSPDSIEIDFDNVTISRSRLSRFSSYHAHGTLFIGSTFLRADLEQSFSDFPVALDEDGWVLQSAPLQFESHIRMHTDHPDSTNFVHSIGSWAAIPGLGSFDINGTASRMDTDGDLRLTLSGVDSLTILRCSTTRGELLYRINDGNDGRVGLGLCAPQFWR